MCGLVLLLTICGFLGCVNNKSENGVWQGRGEVSETPLMAIREAWIGCLKVRHKWCWLKGNWQLYWYFVYIYALVLCCLWDGWFMDCLGFILVCQIEYIDMPLRCVVKDSS